MKITKKVYGVALALVVTSFFGGNLMTAKADWHDIDYGINYTGDGGDLYTPWADKEDRTSHYIFHQGNIDVRVNLIDSYYNSYSLTPYQYAKCGSKYKMLNNLKESYEFIGYYAPVRCCLKLTPVNHSGAWIWGKWSPDSI